MKKKPENMTVEEELENLIHWANQQDFKNVAEALRRTLIKVQEHAAK